ncbi:MAG: hypothetical protein WB820_17945 [Rhodoplanes sp.]
MSRNAARPSTPSAASNSRRNSTCNASIRPRRRHVRKLAQLALGRSDRSRRRQQHVVQDFPERPVAGAGRVEPVNHTHGQRLLRIEPFGGDEIAAQITRAERTGKERDVRADPESQPQLGQRIE